MRRTARRWVGRAREKFADRQQNYAKWLEAHVAQRQARLTTHAQAGQFSFLTGVYEKTPPELFRETAAAVFAQTSQNFEWVLLAHGVISEELQRVISEVASDSRVCLIQLDENRGIIGGMRVCLENATGKYVIPLDADDLLFPDALQVCAQAIQEQGFPKFLYTDEDHYSNDKPRSPFQRPDWDPILNQSGSYIWHLCAFDREMAIRLGVYSDAGANYCHDWDTVFRFARAGVSPHHVPEIVYHWRTHAGSHTNRRERHPGSLQSQRHVLQTQIDSQPRPELFEVRPFPVDRGATEWWISRRSIDPPTVDLIRYGESSDRQNSNWDFPFENRIGVRADVTAILHAASESTAEYVVIIAGGLAPAGDAGFWEAVGLFELNPQLAMIAGRVVNRAGVVRGGGEVRNASGDFHCPELGYDADDLGPFSIWLKPRCIDAVDPRFFFARTSFLNLAAQEFSGIEYQQLGYWLGEFAESQNSRIATSPLINALE